MQLLKMKGATALRKKEYTLQYCFVGTLKKREEKGSWAENISERGF